MEPTKPTVIPLYARSSREEEADHALNNTQFSRGLPWLLCVVFLLTIAFEQVVQHIADVRACRTWQAQQAASPTRKLFRVFDITTLLPTGKQIATAKTFSDYWHLLPPVKKIHSYEDALGNESVLGGEILPRTQAVLTNCLGAGNEKVYPGKEHWLFYRPEVEYLTKPGFLTSHTLKSRILKEGSVQPDPVNAIVDFNRQLAARGITLIVMPAPSKLMLYPEHFAAGCEALSLPLQNPSYRSFLQALHREGVRVFDAGDMMTAVKRAHPSEQLYLKADTHWTPQNMEYCARTLADYLAQEHLLPAAPPASYLQHAAQINNIGDLALMLKLPQRQQQQWREKVTIHQVYLPDGAPWSPTPDADVLLLGDSYSNIFSLDGMGWGEGAGFAEQLSAAMQRPLDKIVINAGGSYSTRAQLYQEMRRGHDRLAGKRVVIYEFAVRDLSEGDWQLYQLPHVAAPVKPVMPPPGTSNPPIKPTGETPSITPTGQGPKPEHPIKPAQPTPIKPSQPTLPIKPPPTVSSALRVQGAIKAISTTPKPGSVPYKDCLIAIELTQLHVLSGQLAAKQIVVYVWGLKDNHLATAASYQPGQTVTLTLQPWSKVEGKYGGYNRVEPEDPDAMVLDPYWGEVR